MSGARSPGVRQRPVFSPLRYPGGKSYLYGTLRQIIRANGLSGGNYVEPYAGGAGAALGLLFTGEVSRIHINDLNPAMFAFWKSVVENTDDFAARIDSANLTMTEWEQHRDTYRSVDRVDYFELGFSTFYMNRTNRSGALNGGPIGGRDQTGNYKIDARFNKKTLIERLRLLRLYADKITVSRLDGADLIAEVACDRRTLIYADPPYFEKAGSLYMNSFSMGDHRRLAEVLLGANSSRWVLTYDDVPQVAELYGESRRTHVALNYSAHRVMKAQEIMVFSDALSIPPESAQLPL